MRLRDSIAVRLTPKQRGMLEEMSESTGLTKTDILRIALERFLSDVQRTGKLELPVQIAREEKEEYRTKKPGRGETQSSK